MNVEELKKSGRIIFEAVMGSHAYGLSTPKSDEDIRGIYVNPKDEYLGLEEPAGQISTDKENVVYYSLKRFFELALPLNPNIIELFFAPADCVRICEPAMKRLIAARQMFASTKCYHTFSGYAYGQIKKAKGQHKMVNQPELAVAPKKEDFCWVIPNQVSLSPLSSFIRSVFHIGEFRMPARPIPLGNAESLLGLRLDECHCSALEHVPNTYRLYYYGPGAKGVFRGDDMLACESIPMDDEIPRFWGLLIYNQAEFDKALREHRKYEEWMSNRNESRWVDQEKGLVDFDQKNMMHCMRLLMSGEHFLTYGEPIVRFGGEPREYLMRIRRGEFSYNTIMADVEAKMKTLDDLYKTSSLPHSVNYGRIERLYRDLAQQAS
jgi:predicted nucleotidyltransferase